MVDSERIHDVRAFRGLGRGFFGLSCLADQRDLKWEIQLKSGRYLPDSSLNFRCSRESR
jgi:hypothetical protein